MAFRIWSLVLSRICVWVRLIVAGLGATGARLSTEASTGPPPAPRSREQPAELGQAALVVFLRTALGLLLRRRLRPGFGHRLLASEPGSGSG